MGLVDGERIDADLLQEPVEVGVDEALGRDEYESERTLAQVHFVAKALRIGERAIELGGGDPARPQAIDLVFHQGNERRNDNRRAAAKDCGGLVAKRLAAAGRQDDKGIAAGEDGLHRLLLERTQAAKAPVAGRES